MQFRVPGLGLVALAAAMLLGHAAAKPPDLPDNPPVIVQPVPQVPSLPPSIWAQFQPQSLFPPPPPEVQYQLTLSPWAQQMLMTAMLYNVHPFLTFVPQEPIVALVCCEEEEEKPVTRTSPCTCPYQPADNHARAICDPEANRTVLDNLEALAKAEKLCARAKKLLKQDRPAEAMVVLEKVCALVPGSNVEQQAQTLIEKVRSDNATEPDCGCCWMGCLGQFGMCEIRALCEWIQKCEGEKAATHCKVARTKQGRIDWSPCYPACSGGDYALDRKLAQPVTMHCVNMPLGVVLDELRECCGFTIVTQGDVCLQQPVSLHIEQMPVRMVLDMLTQPRGMNLCCQGNVVCVCSHPTGCGKCAAKCGSDACCKTGACFKDPSCCAAGKCCQDKKCCADAACCKDGKCCDKKNCCADAACCKKAGCCKDSKCCKDQKCSQAEERCEEQSSECSTCEKQHAKFVKKLHKQEKREKKAKRRAGIDEQVTGLMKACYLAIEQERYEKAADLARQAYALDPVRVEGDPVIYKFCLIESCEKDPQPMPCECPAVGKPSNNYPQQKSGEGDNLSLRPALPGVDPAIVEALDAVLTSQAFRGAGQECRIECVPGPASVRCQVQVGQPKQIFIVGNERTRKNVITRQGPIHPQKTVTAPNYVFGSGVNSNAGLTGSIVVNERNFDVASQKGCPFTRAMREFDWDAVNRMALAAFHLCQAPAIPPQDGKGCVTLGLSSLGTVNVYFRSKPQDGVVYNAILKDGVFFVWTTEAKKAD